MAFDKKYPNRKDWRKPYYDSRRHDWSCRNHGSCDYCRGNRLHKSMVRLLSAEQQLKEDS